MITLTSNTQSAQELSDTLAAHGIIPDAPEPPAAPSEPAKPPVQPDAPGGETPKAAGGETASTPEVEKPKTQEAKAPAPPEEPEPSRGKFKAEKQKLRDRISQLTDDLDLEKGSKAKLRAELDEVQAKLAALTKPAEVAPKDVGPVRPKRPTRAEHDFDDDKHETALAQYDQDMEAYHAAMRDKTVSDALAKRDVNDQEKAAKEQADRVYADFEKKRDEQKKEISGYEEMREAAGDFNLSEFVELAIIQSEVPAYMVHHFLKDAAENDGAELARISRLDPLIQVRELGKLEARLSVAREQASKKPETAVAAVVAEAPVTPHKPEATPAKPPARPAVEPPIEPLGSRTTGRTPMLGEAKTAKEYIALRNKGIAR